MVQRRYLVLLIAVFVTAYILRSRFNYSPLRAPATSAHDRPSEAYIPQPFEHGAHTPDPSPISDVPIEIVDTEVETEGQDLGDDAKALRALCDQTQWRDGLWLRCHSTCGANQTSMCGGLNNARNRIQTCLRYAIDAGMGVILPSIALRNESEIVFINSDTDVCVDKFWDISHLQKQLGEQCPQLQIRGCNDLREIDTVLDVPFRLFFWPSWARGGFRNFLEGALLKLGINSAEVTPSNSTLVNFSDTHLGFDYRNSSELTTIRKALFKTLDFNQHLLELSSKVLNSPKLQGQSFIGVHLRGENDWPQLWGSLDAQMTLYTEDIQRIQTTSPTESKIIFVSCGNSSAIDLFRDKLSALGYTIYDKWTLLADQTETLAQLDKLSFDEKAIVEYFTLLKSDVWLGIYASTMSLLIAYARSVDDKDDFFETYVTSRGEGDPSLNNYIGPVMKGNDKTRLLVVTPTDIMDKFP